MQSFRQLRLLAALIILPHSFYAQSPVVDAGSASTSASGVLQNDRNITTLHAGTHLVVLDVVVTNKRGHTVPGLSKSDFELFEDGQRQQVKVFEEHDPLDPSLVAKEEAEVAAKLPLNTFTSYEPVTGNSVTVLLLNKLSALPDYDLEPLRQRILSVIGSAPPNAPFAVYQLDSQLRLVQPVTTNRDLLRIAVNRMWQQAGGGVTPQELGLSLPEHATYYPAAELVLARRKVFTAAMQQLSATFGPEMGGKSFIAFTGGIRCWYSSAPGCASDAPDIKPWLCSVIDSLEQARISLYRYYPNGQLVYGFGCSDRKETLRRVFDTNAHYYTFYYTPTNQDWDGKYRKFSVASTNKQLHLSYRAGYYAREENAEAHDYEEDEPPMLPTPVGSGRPIIPATAVVASAKIWESLDTGSAKVLPNPVSAVFNVEVTPAVACSTDNKGQEYRELTLHFTMPALEFKVAPSGGGGYAALLEIIAVPNVDGKALDTYGSEVEASFNSTTDPDIATSTIAATLTVSIPEHGRNRWLFVSVRDMATGQFGSLVIPMNQVIMP